MFLLGLHLFCIFMVLVIVKMKHATDLQYERRLLFQRDADYDGIVPNDASFYIESFEGDSEIRCCRNCKRDRASCVGILNNKQQMKCKLLKRYLTVVDKLGNIGHSGWEYFRITEDFDEMADSKGTAHGFEDKDLDEDADCKRSTFGWDYRGTINVTTSGRRCQAWASQSPHSHIIGTTLPENYCRNPGYQPTLWCYTTDPNIRDELCDIPICVTPPLECLTEQDPFGIYYFGTQNVAGTGDLCQRWDSQTPHSHSYPHLSDQDNYCRNPTTDFSPDSDAPWCYTANPYKRWSNCIIPRC